MITTTTSLPAPVQQTLDSRLLSVPVPRMVHGVAAEEKRMPSKGGTTLRMRRYNRLATATAPLGNQGVTPPPQQMRAVDIDAQIQFYGTWVPISEQVNLQAQDGVLNETVKQLGISLDVLGDVKLNLNTMGNLRAEA